MSTSILKRSLELFSHDLDKLDKPGNSKKKKKLLRKGANKKKQLKLVDMKKEQSVDFTNKNLKYLARLSRPHSSKPAVEKLLDFQKLQERRKKPKMPKKEKTVFTEEDFEKFEREYFVKLLSDEGKSVKERKPICC